MSRPVSLCIQIPSSLVDACVIHLPSTHSPFTLSPQSLCLSQALNPTQNSKLPSHLIKRPSAPGTNNAHPNTHAKGAPLKRPNTSSNAPAKSQSLEDQNDPLRAPDGVVEVLYKRDLRLRALVPEIVHMRARRVQEGAEADADYA